MSERSRRRGPQDASHVECPDRRGPRARFTIHDSLVDARGGAGGRVGGGAREGRVGPCAGVGSPPGKKVSWNWSEGAVAQHRECAKCH